MGAIKDLLDLTAQLINSVKDRRIAAELAKIQSLISTVQSEYFEARERNVQLLADNARLQQQVTDLQTSHAQEIASLKQKHSDVEAKSAQEHAAEVARLKDTNSRAGNWSSQPRIKGRMEQ